MPRLPARATVLLLPVLLAAGCLGGADPGPGPSPAGGPAGDDGIAPDDGLDATAETGLLRGVVVDQAIRPLAGVDVAVRRGDASPLRAQTGQDGRFGFDGLEPGSYVVEAARAGYFPATAVAAVRAGVADPPVVSLLLERDDDTVAYVEAYALDGFMECGVRGGTGGVALCQLVEGRTNLTSDRTLFKIPVTAAPSWVQAEMAWEMTQPLADTMGLYVRQLRPDGTDAYMGIYPLNLGPSPLLLAIDSDGAGHCATCVEDPLNMTQWEEAWFSAMAGDLSATRPPETCSPLGSPCLAGAGVVLEQRFQLFVHVFHRATPAEGWRFTSDGPPAV
jgi:hypothetical protein